MIVPAGELYSLVRGWRDYIPTPDNDFADGRWTAFQECAHELATLLKTYQESQT